MILQGAHRYAKALANLAGSSEQRKSWEGDLTMIAQLLEQNDAFRQLLLHPQISAESKIELLKRCLGGEAESELIRFFSLLLQRGKLKILPEIAKEFHRLTSDTLEARLTTAVPADNATRDRLRQKLESFFKKAVSVQEEIDPLLLGGLILTIGGKLLDCSLRNRLANLKQQLLRV